jgi:hypothetical protein
MQCRVCYHYRKRFCFEHQERVEPTDPADDCAEFRRAERGKR